MGTLYWPLESVLTLLSGFKSDQEIRNLSQEFGPIRKVNFRNDLQLASNWGKFGGNLLIRFQIFSFRGEKIPGPIMFAVCPKMSKRRFLGFPLVLIIGLGCRAVGDKKMTPVHRRFIQK